jgi:hypothetical protein
VVLYTCVGTQAGKIKEGQKEIEGCMSTAVDFVFYFIYGVPGLFATKRSIALYESYILKKYDGSTRTNRDGSRTETIRQVKMDSSDWVGAVFWGVVAGAVWPAFFTLDVLAKPAKWFFIPPVQKEVERHEFNLAEMRADALRLSRIIEETKNQAKALPSGLRNGATQGVDDLEEMLAAKRKEIIDFAADKLGRTRESRETMDLSGGDWQ